MLGWMNHKLESRLLGEIPTTSESGWHHSNGVKWGGTKEPLDEGERREWKSWLKTQHADNYDHGNRYNHFMANKWGKVETVAIFPRGKTGLLLLSRLSRVRLCATPWTAAHQAPPSLGFSWQEHWSGLPFPSPMHESEKWKWRRSVVSDS